MLRCAMFLALCVLAFVPEAFCSPKRVADLIFPVEEERMRRYCDIDSMLGFRADPGLSRDVESLEIFQYLAERDASGAFVKVSLMGREKIVFFQSGKPRLFERDYQGDGVRVLRSEYAEDGSTIVMTNRDAGEESTYTYTTVTGDDGRPLRLELWNRERLVRVEAEYEYDDAARTIRQLNSLDQLTVVEYDEKGRPIRESLRPKNKPDNEVLVYEAEYDRQDRPVNYLFHDLEQGMRQRVQWEYDADSRLVRVLRARARGQEEPIVYAREEYVYDDSGCLSSLYSMYEPLEYRVTYNRDENGKVVSVFRDTKDHGDESVEHEEIFFVNDERGNWIRAERDSIRFRTIIERTITYFPN